NRADRISTRFRTTSDASLASTIERTVKIDIGRNLLVHADGTRESIPDFDTDPVWLQRLIALLKTRGLLIAVAAIAFERENDELIEAGDTEREKKLCALIEAEALSKQSFVVQVAYSKLNSQ